MVRRTDEEIRSAVKNVLLRIGLIHETDVSGCYKIRTDHFKKNGLDGILNGRFGGSAIRCILFCFPDYDWDILKFEKKPQGFWKQQDNVRLVLDRIQKQKGWTRLDDFYKLTKEDIPQGLHDRIPCLFEILKFAYPNHPWTPIRMNRIPNGTWENFEYHKEAVRLVEQELGITNPRDWYTKLSSDVFNSRFGGYLLEHYYEWSPTKLICTIYPELQTRIWLFGKTPNSFWKDEANTRLFLTELFKELQLSLPEDWYKVTCDDFDSFGGSHLVNAYGGHINTIIQFADVPAGFEWNRGKFRSTWTTERMVGDYLQSSYDIFRGAEFSPEWLKHKTSPYKMDITLKDLPACVEIDGPGHFRPMWYGSHEGTLSRDILKMKYAYTNGYSGMRLHQADVYNDVFDWKAWIQKAIQLIQSSETPIWVFPENNTTYTTHIRECETAGIPLQFLPYS